MEKGKRRFQRIPFKVPAELVIKDATYHTDSICNLSIGGCLFPLPAGFDSEERSKCRLIIPLNEQDNRAQVAVEGEVIYCEQGMAGIKFTKIDPNSLFHLHNIIRYNAVDPDEVEHEIHEHPGIV